MTLAIKEYLPPPDGAPTLALPRITGGGRKSVKARFGWAVLLAMLAGCAKQPFAPEPLPVLRNPNPPVMRESFARVLPNRFTSDDTVIIQAPFHDDLAALGVLQVDRSAGTFELVALNHLGIKLFDLRGDHSGVSVVFALPPLMKHKGILLAIGRDIQRMYLDLIPDSGAKVVIESKDIRFSEDRPDGTLIYKFGGEHSSLLEKRLDGFFGMIWRVRYYLYGDESGALYPHGVVMDNGRYHYRIIVKNRDVEIER